MDLRFLSRWVSCVACLFTVACQREPRPAAILLFMGTGTSAGDVAAVEKLLDDAHFDYATATSRQLDAMSAPRLRSYRLLIIPGGNFEQMGNNLSAATATNVRDAVHQGLNYLGICAGALLAKLTRGLRRV